MKHYLDLVPISAKIHKKQSRMSIFCIVLAVFLVTTIFGMADMFIRSQILQAQQESGNWHIAIKNISNEEAAIIASRPDIEVFSPYGVLNYRGDLGYTLGGKDVAICGCDESYITEIWTDQIEEGVFPQTSNEALVTENAKQIMGVAIGDPIAVETPDGDKLNFTISGFMNNTASIMSGDSYGIILNTEDYCAIYPNVSDGEPNDYGIMFFTQFANTRNTTLESRSVSMMFCGSEIIQSINDTVLPYIFGTTIKNAMTPIKKIMTGTEKTTLPISFLSTAAVLSGSFITGGTTSTTRTEFTVCLPLALVLWSVSSFCTAGAAGVTFGTSKFGASPMLSNKCLLIELFLSSLLCSIMVDSYRTSPIVEAYCFW